MRGRSCGRKCERLVPPLLSPPPKSQPQPGHAPKCKRVQSLRAVDRALVASLFLSQVCLRTFLAPMSLCACRYGCALLHTCKFMVPAKINARTDVCLSKRARRAAWRRMCKCVYVLHSQLCSSWCPAPFALQAPPPSLQALLLQKVSTVLAAQAP